MCRCLELAKKAAGYAAPNPVVGAVLVHEGKIIGEGWHERYGQAHAEVNCLAAVKEADRHLISQSTLYVSLEPCAHYGKTPPCADLIVQHKIPKVVIGCVDSFAKVAGKGIEKLKKAGIQVILEGPWQKDCLELNRPFFTFHSKKRPFIVLKWAQSEDGFIAPLKQDNEQQRLLISGPLSNRLVHKWRSESAAILVGKNTAIKDNPSLNTRLYPGPSPIRMAIDPVLEIPATHQLLDGSQKTVIFNQLRAENLAVKSMEYFKVSTGEPLVRQILDYCYAASMQSLLVEGGSQLLASFIEAGLWDEIRIITNTQLQIGAGLKAPTLPTSRLLQSFELDQDKISYFAPLNG